MLGLSSFSQRGVGEMRQLSFKAINKIKEMDNSWVKTAEDLVANLDENKERQLRIIQSMAESSNSWEVVKLFIRYQAARNKIDKDWADKEVIPKLEALQNNAKSMVIPADNAKDVHMEIVSRVLGYAVRWHVWNNTIKGRKEISA